MKPTLELAREMYLINNKEIKQFCLSHYSKKQLGNIIELYEEFDFVVDSIVRDSKIKQPPLRLARKMYAINNQLINQFCLYYYSKEQLEPIKEMYEEFDF